MAAREVTRNAPAMPQAPIDENVPVPESVRRAAAEAAAIHAQAYPVAQPDPVVVDPPVVDPPVQVDPPAVVQPAPVAQVQPPVTQADEGQWEHRYNSMKGRYDAAARTIGQMQEQMTQLGDELQRTQHLLSQPVQTRIPANQPLITEEEKQHYSPELIDVMQRAAQEAIAPALAAVTDENKQLKQTLAQASRATMLSTLDQQLPNWRLINDSDAFKAWIRLPDVYSGRVRYDMLRDAVRAANAPRVIAFFNGFVRDEAIITGTGAEPVPQPAAGVEPPAPRVAAVPLATLAAPGRAKPAGSGAAAPADKPYITRAQIAEFYRNVTRGVYDGRAADKANDEGIIMAAQREGRVT